MPAIHLLISALYMRVCVLFVVFVLFLFAYLSYFHHFSFFSLTFTYLLPSRILDPLRFQAGGRRRRPNLGLVCFVLMFAVFLVKDASVRYVVVDLVLVL